MKKSLKMRKIIFKYTTNKFSNFAIIFKLSQKSKIILLKSKNMFYEILNFPLKLIKYAILKFRREEILESSDVILESSYVIPESTPQRDMILKTSRRIPIKLPDDILYKEYTDERLRKKIMEKLGNHSAKDRKTPKYINLDYVISLLIIQNEECHICRQKVLLYEWDKYCSYQFTIDRIDNSLPHIKGNVLISCFYCNCINPYSSTQNFKLCSEKCHTNPVAGIRLKKDVPEEEIKEWLEYVRFLTLVRGDLKNLSMKKSIKIQSKSNKNQIKLNKNSIKFLSILNQ